MVEGLLDTAVVINILRKYPPALSWLTTRGQLGVTSIVWLEVLEGARNKVAQQTAIAELNKFELVETLQEDHEWTVRQLIKYQPL